MTPIAYIESVFPDMFGIPRHGLYHLASYAPEAKGIITLKKGINPVF